MLEAASFLNEHDDQNIYNLGEHQYRATKSVAQEPYVTWANEHGEVVQGWLKEQWAAGHESPVINKSVLEHLGCPHP